MSNLDTQIKTLGYIVNALMLLIGFFCGVIYEREFNPVSNNNHTIEQLATDNPLDDASLISWDEAYGTELDQDKRYFSIVPTATKQVSTESPRIGKLVD